MSVRGSNWLTSGAGGWLPTMQQVSDALQLHLPAAIGTLDDPEIEEPLGTSTSMRQGLGLVLLTGLLAGLIPFLVNWVVAARVGTALPLAQLSRSIGEQANAMGGNAAFLQPWTETIQTIAGLSPNAPGWLAAGLSALGVWVNQPLSWLAAWIIYGLGILLVSKLFGATATLQHFYAATSYAYLPLILTALGPVPCLGPLAILVALIWSLFVYVRAVQHVTHLDTGRAILSVILPVAFMMLVGILLVGAVAISMLRLAM